MMPTPGTMPLRLFAYRLAPPSPAVTIEVVVYYRYAVALNLDTKPSTLNPKH
jgi:hypothetical protein